MSFDLFVLLGKTDAETQRRWVANLKQSGVEAQFPEGFVIGDESDSDITVQCRLLPPLVNEPVDFESHEFNLDFSKLDDESRKELCESTEDVTLHQGLNRMTSELQLYSQAGRSDQALIVQCFAAACLADAADGMLLDPQEFGLVNGTQAYAVAQSHCQYEINQGLKAGQKKTAVEPSDVTEKNIKNQQGSSKEKKGVSVVLFILLFIALRNLLMN